MITKTYLDNRLNQLEEQLKRKIEMKDEVTLHKIETDIANLKNDIKLFETSNDLLNNISWTNEDLVRKNNVVNIISDFDMVGVPDKSITHKKYFQFAILFGGLMLLWILLQQLNKYLKDYKRS